MSRRSTSIRQVNRLRTSTKIALTVAGTTIAGLATLLIIVFNLSKQEVSMAESPMVFNTADVLQDTNTVLRGSINQQVIGLVIATSGTGSPLKISSITFSANKTSEPVAKNIENARLWYTGKERNFNTSLQIGSSVPQITSNVFDIIVNKTLNAGKNYFWLTLDVKPDAQTKNGAIDAECVSLKIGAIDFLPMISSPSGKKSIALNIPYFSTGNFSVDNPEAWNSKRDGSGIAPKKSTDVLNTYFIQSGHRMICSKENKMPAVVIEKNALLKADQPLRLKNMIIMDGGTYRQDFSLNENYCFENFKIENGGNYIHNNSGKLPSKNCIFSPRSNECFYQLGESTFSQDEKWGNVLINSTSNTDLEIKNNFHKVMGDFEIRKIGINHFAFASANDSLNIDGSLIISGGAFAGAVDIATLTINVGEDFIMKDGVFNSSNGKTNATSVLNIHGDVLFLGGIFDFSKSDKSEINILDSKTKTIYWMQKGGNVTLGNMNILQGKEMIVKGGKLGDIASGKTLTVNNGAKLMCCQSPVTGDGKFVLKENATLGIGSIKGISSTGVDGNILTKERYYDSGAHYVYHTNSSPQTTGIFATQPSANTVKSLTIKKDKPTDEVVLLSDLTVTDQVYITMGDLNKGKKKLNLVKLSQNSRATLKN